MFTQEQIKEIKEKLSMTGSKDNSLPLAKLPLTGTEIIALIQEGQNRKVSIDEFYEEFSQYIDQARVDFFNVSRYVQRITGTSANVQLTLEEAAEICPQDIRRGGQVITFLDNESNWALWQYTGTSSDNWSIVDEYWENLESDPNLGIDLTSSVSDIPFGSKADVTVHFETLDGGKAKIVELYVNESLYQTYQDVSEFDVVQSEIDADTTFRVYAEQYGKSYGKEVAVTVTYPAWIGAGTDESAVQTDDNEVAIKTEINDTFDVVFEDTGYLIIIIPDFVVLNPVTMNGFEVPMQAASVKTVSNVNYRIYKSANKYIAGVHRFVVGTYSGDERDLMQSMQQDITVLQELVGEQSEEDNSQILEIAGIKERLDTLEENTYITTDEEDLTTVGGTYKFADKTYDAVRFSGKGRIYLRKNIVTVEDRIDENTVISQTVNMLTTPMVSAADSIYIVQYDYTLRGGTITLPAGSVLQYAGGSVSNGTLDVTGTVLLPGWENLIGENLTITGIPAAGSWYFNVAEGKLLISNGEVWLEIEGSVVS